MLEQILVNLVDNAGKYAQASADRRLHVGWKGAGKFVELYVRDHGPGLPHGRFAKWPVLGRSPLGWQRWFRPFSKTVQEAADAGPGIGLGLALSRRLAQQMRGNLWIDSRVRDGACVVVALPTHRGGLARMDEK
jgi:signal transduction histidine kinase